MRAFFLPGLVAAAILSFSPLASAQPTAASLNDAIALCRTTVAQQAGVELTQARFDQAQTRSHAYRIDIDLWTNGQLTNVRCEVAKGETLTVASISPALQTATAQR